MTIKKYVLAVLAIFFLFVFFSACEEEKVDNSDKVAVLITAWGQPSRY
ncbi:MAG: hypothetical protein GY762_21435, partial [Proteobacteria bacterium]|nr:hypothetical protein [Pseudomonadota bacterium]